MEFTFIPQTNVQCSLRIPTRDSSQSRFPYASLEMYVAHPKDGEKSLVTCFLQLSH